MLGCNVAGCAVVPGNHSPALGAVSGRGAANLVVTEDRPCRRGHESAQNDGGKELRAHAAGPHDRDRQRGAGRVPDDGTTGAQPGTAQNTVNSSRTAQTHSSPGYFPPSVNPP